MSWMKSGYEEAEKARDSVQRRGPQSFWIRPEETQRVLFLDDEPSVFWEHGYKWNGKYGNFTPCLEKNGLADSCPLCENVKNNYASLVGLFTVITLTEVVAKRKDGSKASYCFQRKIFRAKMGSKEKPGVLKKIERLKQKHGRLRGLVIECFRNGSKTESVGDELTVVEEASIDPDLIMEKSLEMVEPYINRLNKTLSGDQKIDVNKFLKDMNPWKSFDFDEIIKPMEYKQMLAKFPPFNRDGDDEDSGYSSRSNKRSSRNEDEDYGSDAEDDSVPY